MHLPRRSGSLVFAAVALVSLAGRGHAQAPITWANAGTAFATDANWIGGLAPQNDTTTNLASFGDISVQPSLASARSVAGLVFAGSTTGTLSGGSLLTLGASGITVNASAGITTLSTPLSLAANQSFTGDATLRITGTVATGGRILTLAGGHVSNAITSIVSGSGGIRKTGTGTWTLSGNNTYTGTTTVAAGSLVFTTAVPGPMQIDAGAMLTLNNGGLSLSYIEKPISGDGILTIDCPNATTHLRTNSTFSGTTLITANSTLTFGGGNAGGIATGSLAGPIVMGTNAQFSLLRSNTLTYGGAISGPGSIFKNNGGTTALTGSSTFSGGTRIYGGLIEFTNLDNLGSGTVRLDGGGIRWAAGSTVDLSGRLAPLGDGSYLFNNGGGTFDTNGNDVTLASVLSGSTRSGGVGGGLTKLGTGTLSLAAANTYPGTTTISAGALRIGTGGTTGSIASASVVNNALLVFDRADDFTFGIPISGTGGLLMQGGGRLILTSSNSFTGTASVASGTLAVGNGGTAGSLTGDIANAGAVVFNRSDAVTYAGAFSGTGTVVKAGVGTLSLTGSSTGSGNVTVAAGTLSIGAGGTSGSLAAPVVNQATVVFNRSDASTYAGAISGTGGVVKSGSGLLSLLGDNTFTAPLTITGGTVGIGSGGTSGSIVADVITGGVLAFNRSDAVTFAGTISGTGSLAMVGPGSLTLSGSNSYTGLTTISTGTLTIGTGGTVGSIASGTVANGGVLRFNRSSAFAVGGSITGTGSVAVLGGGTATFGRASTFTGDLSVTGGGIVASTAANLGSASGTVRLVGSTLTAGGGFTATRSLVLATGTVAVPSGVMLQWDGLVSGAGGLAKTSSGTLSLTAANTFTGSLAVQGGLVQFSTLANLGSGSVSLDGGGLRWATASTADPSSRLLPLGAGGATFDTGGNDVSFATALSGTGQLVKTGSGVLVLSATNGYGGGTLVTGGLVGFTSLATLGSGRITLDGGGLRWAAGSTADPSSRLDPLGASGGTFDTGTNAITMAGAISGSGGLTKSGLGRLTLSASNAYAGATAITSGTLLLGNAAAIPSASIITVASGAVLDLGAFSATLNGLQGQGSVAIGTGTLTLGADGGTATFSGTLAGTGGVMKAGSGTITLAAANTYSGATTVASGILRVTHADALGSTSAGTTITAAASLEVDGVALNAEPITLSGSGAGGAGAVIGSGTGSLGGRLTLAAATAIGGSGTMTVSGSIGESGGTHSLTKLGAGTTILAGTNGFSGGLTLTSGTVAFSADVNLGAAGGAVTFDGGALQATASLASSRAATVTGAGGTLVADPATTLTWNGSIGGVGGILKTGQGTLVLGGSNTFLGQLTIAAGAVGYASDSNLGPNGVVIGSGTLRLPAGGTSLRVYTDLAGANATIDTNGGSSEVGVGLTGTGGLTKAGLGTLTLFAGNAYGGATNITAGSLRLGNSDALPDSTPLTIAAAATFDMADANETIRSLAGTGTVVLGVGTLTVGAGNASSSFGGVIAGTGQVVKTGTGVQALTGTSFGSMSVAAMGGLVEFGTPAAYAGTLSFDGGGLRWAAGTSKDFSSQISTIGGGGVVFDTGTNAVTFTTGVMGNGGLTKSGSGTLTLAAASYYANATTVSAGTLALGVANALPTYVPLTVATGAVLALNGYSTEVASISGAGRVTLGSGTMTVGSDGNSTTFSGIISGSGGLTKVGAGTLALSSGQTYTGTTRIEAGAILLGSSGIASPSIINGGALSFGYNDQFACTYGGSISGTGEVTSGPWLKFTGNNTFSGPLNHSNGFLWIGTGGTTGSITANITKGRGASGVVAFNRSDTLIYTGTISGGLARIEQNGAGNLVFTANHTYATFYGAAETFITSGTLTLGSGGTTGSVPTPTLVNGGVLQFNRSDDWTYEAAISDYTLLIVPQAGRIVQLGTGAITLTGNSSFTAGTTLANGTLVLGSANAIGTSGTITFAGGALRFSAANTSDVSGRFSQAAGPQYRIDTGGQSVAFATGLTGTGGSLAKLGGGTLTLTASNAFTAGTTLTAGTLALGSAGALGITGTISFTGGTLRASGSNTTDYSPRFSQVAGQQVRLDTAGQNVTLATALSSVGGSLTKLGSGTLTLSGSNSYDGGTTIAGGVLRLASANRLADGGDVSVTGGSLDLGGFAETIGVLTMTSGTVTSGTISATAYNVSGGALLATLGGTGGFTQSGSGLTTLGGTNSFPAGTTLSGGTLALGSSGAIGSTGTIAFTGGVLRFSASNTTDYSPRFSQAAGQQVRLDTNAQSISLAAPLASAGGSLTKLGSGTLSLSGSSTYDGGTTIAGGLVAALGSAALGSGTVTVNAGGTLWIGPDALLANAIASSGTLAFAGGGITRSSRLSLGSVAELIAGSAGAPVVIAPEITWLPRSGSNTISDILDLQGTAGAVQIVSMTYDPSLLGIVPPEAAFLGWQTAGDWANAVLGNIGPAGSSAVIDASGDFAVLGVQPTAAYLGSWGRDTTTNTVWAVIDHNSQFVAVPEPAMLGMVATAVAVATIARRGKARSRRRTNAEGR